MVNYWLFKSEPGVYSIDDMKRDNAIYWEGIRNYQARNFMRACTVGDRVLFYHSNAKPPGAVGECKIVKEAWPDPEQFNPESKYFDPKASFEKPRWTVVDIEFVSKFDRLVSLQEMKENAKLAEMKLVQKGCRLSVMPVSKEEFEEVLLMGKE